MTPRSERGGVRKQEVERQLREALADIPGARISVGFGDYDPSLAKLNLAERQVPIVVKLPSAARQCPASPTRRPA